MTHTSFQNKFRFLIVTAVSAINIEKGVCYLLVSFHCRTLAIELDALLRIVAMKCKGINNKDNTFLMSNERKKLFELRSFSNGGALLLKVLQF